MKSQILFTHETIVITTMLAQVGYANATLNHDKVSQAMFRGLTGKNVTANPTVSIL